VPEEPGALRSSSGVRPPPHPRAAGTRKVNTAASARCPCPRPSTRRNRSRIFHVPQHDTTGVTPEILKSCQPGPPATPVDPRHVVGAPESSGPGDSCLVKFSHHRRVNQTRGLGSVIHRKATVFSPCGFDGSPWGFERVRTAAGARAMLPVEPAQGSNRQATFSGGNFSAPGGQRAATVSAPRTTRAPAVSGPPGVPDAPRVSGRGADDDGHAAWGSARDSGARRDVVRLHFRRNSEKNHAHTAAPQPAQCCGAIPAVDTPMSTLQPRRPVQVRCRDGRGVRRWSAGKVASGHARLVGRVAVDCGVNHVRGVSQHRFDGRAARSASGLRKSRAVLRRFGGGAALRRSAAGGHWGAGGPPRAGPALRARAQRCRGLFDTRLRGVGRNLACVRRADRLFPATARSAMSAARIGAPGCGRVSERVRHRFTSRADSGAVLRSRAPMAWRETSVSCSGNWPGRAVPAARPGTACSWRVRRVGALPSLSSFVTRVDFVSLRARGLGRRPGLDRFGELAVRVL